MRCVRPSNLKRLSFQLFDIYSSAESLNKNGGKSTRECVSLGQGKMRCTFIYTPYRFARDILVLTDFSYLSTNCIKLSKPKFSGNMMLRRARVSPPKLTAKLISSSKHQTLGTKQHAQLIQRCAMSEFCLWRLLVSNYLVWNRNSL